MSPSMFVLHILSEFHTFPFHYLFISGEEDCNIFIQPMSVQIKNLESSGKCIYKLVIHLKALTLLPLKFLPQISIQFILQYLQLPHHSDIETTGTDRTLKSSNSHHPFPHCLPHQTAISISSILECN